MACGLTKIGGLFWDGSIFVPKQSCQTLVFCHRGVGVVPPLPSPSIKVDKVWTRAEERDFWRNPWALQSSSFCFWLLAPSPIEPEVTWRASSVQPSGQWGFRLNGNSGFLF